MRFGHVALISGVILLAACSGAKPIKPSEQHLQQRPDAPTHSTSDIPQPNKRAIPLPPPKPAAKVETYSVVVSNVSAQEILFALARDAKINLDIAPGVQGSITINAINQTLPQILNRIARQVDMRWELENGTLTVMPDSPYLKTYPIDYVNMTRDSDGTTSAGQAGSLSSGSIKNASKNRFWERLEQNIKDILRETDKILPEGSTETVVEETKQTSNNPPAASTKKTAKDTGGDSVVIEGEGTTVTRRSTFREAASVISNPEAGIITVRANSRQHEKVQEFITKAINNARRQVLIEATIVEVQLNDSYKQGIDWGNVRVGAKGLEITQKGTGLTSATATAGTLILNLANPGTSLGNLSANISLLETFGKTKVLSSPKISVMNNQTSLLRVTREEVYFTLQAQPSGTTVNPVTGATTTAYTYTSTKNAAQIGFTMSVTPQISENDSVLLNVRPTITRVSSYVTDPNPELAKAGVVSRVPQTQTREMESVLKIENNQIAVMGGLMQDEISNTSNEVPVLGQLPFMGELFKSKDDSTVKSELVIFLRPIVIKEPGLDGDFREFRGNLPDQDFFKREQPKRNNEEKPADKRT